MLSALGSSALLAVCRTLGSVGAGFVAIHCSRWLSESVKFLMTLDKRTRWIVFSLVDIGKSVCLLYLFSNYLVNSIKRIVFDGSQIFLHKLSIILNEFADSDEAGH